MENLKKELQNIFKTTNYSDWELVKFGDVVCEVRESCKDPESENINRIVGLEHLTPDDIHIRSWGDISDGTTFTRKFAEGQILFGRRRAYQRKAALATFAGLCSGDIIVMEAQEGLIPKLLPFLIHSERFFEWAVSTSAGSLSPRTKFKDLAKFEFRLPPLPIQEKLAELFWSIDRLQEDYLQLQQSLYRTLQSYFYENFEDKQGVLIELEKIAQINPKTEIDSLNGDIQVDFIPMEAVSEDGEVSLSEKKDFLPSKNSFTLFKNGDIIFAKITPCMENGKGALVENMASEIGLGSTEFHVIRPVDERDALFVYYLTKLPQFRNLAERYMTGSAGQKRVPTNFLKTFKFKAPSITIREKVGSVCHEIWKEKKRLERLYKISKDLQNTVINNIV